MSVVLMGFSAEMARLRSVKKNFTAFCVSLPNESEGKVSFGYANREIISANY